MESYLDKVSEQEELAKQIEHLRSNYKKEPKRRLKDVERLRSWFDKLEQVWNQFKEKHNELLKEPEILQETDYHKNNRFEKIHCTYEDMKANLKYTLSAINLKALNHAEEEEEEEKQEEAEELEESYKTVKNGIARVSTPLPDHIKNYKELEDTAKETILRFENKLKIFEKELNIIENYVMNEMKTRAKLALKDIDKLRNDLADGMEELSFMLGDSAQDLQNQYDELIMEYREILEKTEPIGTRNNTDVNALKLKPVSIPAFSGSFKTWPTFSGLFNTMVIENNSFNDIQRMQYLKTLVTGEAEKSIANIEITGQNFSKAWQILSSRYENKRAIRDTHLELLLKLPHLSFESSSSLREYFDRSKECIELLKDTSGDQILLYLLMKKLPNETRKIYEQSRENPTEEQSLDAYFDFLHKRCQVLEAIECNIRKPDKKLKEKCSHCNNDHAIFMCQQFKNLSVAERREVVKQKQLCLLCLRAKHMVNDCKFKKMCPQCNKKHNGLLHESERFEKKTEKFEKYEKKDQNKRAFVATADDNTVICATAQDGNTINTLLATALIRIKTSHGWSETIRALVDQGSVATFMTERAAKQLNLKQTPNYINISGIAGSAETAKGTVDIQLSARYPTSFKVNITAIIMSKLTAFLPINDFDKSIMKTNELETLTLADPDFNKSARIDMILGADVYAELILDGLIKAEDNSYIAQETEVGWIVSGPINKNSVNSALCMVANMDQIDLDLQRFWEMEEIAEENQFKPEEQKCIEFFDQTVERNANGTYIASLPFKEHKLVLGESRKMAIAQLFQLERKFDKNPDLKEKYVEYMHTLLENGYMKECKYDSETEHCYLPHHPVLKDSTTTKVRPVFDASRKTSNGIALNDMLITGPKLQDDLFNIVARFRMHKIAFTADIEKMYLHVLLNEKDQQFQKIVWRENPNEPVKDYCLTTVTFGISSSPFLAVASVQKHVKSAMINHPEASKIILEDSYMDDISSGCENIQKAIKLQRELYYILADASMPLRKWASNSSELLANIPDNLKEEAKRENGYAYVNTLGLRWFFEMDKLNFKCNINLNEKKLTKRSILSQITTIFDPLGLLSPITIYNKILMQQIWREKIDWDDKVSKNIEKKWNAFVEQASLIEKIKVNRWLQYTPNCKAELHGFSDASEDAMCASIYLKTYENDTIHVNLIAAKTKVAPVKKVTLPKLELCAAVLLAKLMKSIKTALKLENVKTRYYSDSQITLAWIRGDAHKWKTFVANRVTRIQELTTIREWRYINTKANPADFGSRGLLPDQLINNTLWWYGPSVLLNEENIEEYKDEDFYTELEQKKPRATAFHSQIETASIDRFSTLKQAVRAIAYCKKYVQQLKNKNHLQHVLDSDEAKNKVKNAMLDADDLENAKTTIIKMFQAQFFEKEITHLQEKGKLPKESSLKPLYPFIDQNGIMRVGGRLEKSEFSYNKKHPIIIPYGCKLANLIIDEAHTKTMHGGNQLTLCQIRHEYWITAAKRAVKAHINRCVTCHRFRTQNQCQLMGNLPASRTKIVDKAFTHTGTDLCGPIQLKLSSAKGVRTQKGYIVIFICFSTRAIHIEVVTELTADAFIAAFKRLVGRRGHVQHLYCDNGTNFVGANKILQLESEQAILEYNHEIKRSLAVMNTRFHFNPSLSPWMGGLWERGIGSIKYHLKRTVGNRVLNYEELSTVLIQIEAILNSRPISPLSENPEDLDVLTPGHFLVGNALTAQTEPSLLQLKENRLDKWQLCTRMKQEFWEKWSNEYISNLQKRTKWTEVKENMQEGDMVLVKEENTAPLQWPLGRIQKIYPGNDNLVRAVDVLVKGKTYKRPIVKLAKLPIENDTVQSYNESEKDTKKNVESIDTVQRYNETENDVNEESHQTVVKQKRKQTKTGKLKKVAICLFTAIALSCIANVTAQPTHTVSNFEDDNSVFIHKQNNGANIGGHWRLVTYESMAEYDESYTILNDNIRKLRKNTRNQNLLTDIDRKLDELQMFDSMIKIKTNNLQKRSFTTFAVTAIGSIFGYLGAKILDQINGNSDDTQHMLQDQISVLKLADEQIVKMENTSNIMIENEISSSYVFLKLLEFSEKQKIITEMLTNRNAKVNPNWLKPDELAHQIELIAENLPEDLQLIGANEQEKMFAIYQFAKLTTYVTEHTLVSIIEIPLVQKEEYEHVKIYTLPFEHNKVLIKPIVNKPHVWWNEKYVKLFSKKQLDACIHFEKKYYCEFKSQWLTKNKAVACEWQLVRNHTATECEHREVMENETYIELQNNQWLFSARNEVKAKIKCGNEEENTKLHGNGVLILNDNCEIKTPQQKIKASKDITTNTKSSMLEMQLHKVIWPAKTLNLLKFREKLQTTIKTLEMNDNRMVWHQVHHYATIYSIIITLIIIVYYFYSKLELAPEP